MRKAWKTAAAIALVLGLRGAVAKAQPLITGNTAAFGGGPIETSNFTTGLVTQSFIPDAAKPPLCPVPCHNNGRALAVGGTELFYTELTGPSGFGPSDGIHVAPYGDPAGNGGADTRVLPNPRPDSGIQAMTFSGGTLYVLTGYDNQVPIVYGLNLLTGAVLKGPITLTQPGGGNFSTDGFAVLPNGNFLMNQLHTSCIYNEYDKTSGNVVGPERTINVPNAGQCTGVDTDGTSLFFMTDFNSITRTDFDGNPNGFNFWNGQSGEDIFIEDISVVHPVTIITDAGKGHFFFTLQNTDDINTNFDIQAELLLNGNVIGTGLTRCIHSTGVGGIVRNIPGTDVPVPISLLSNPFLFSGDVLAVRVSARIGTNPDDTQCGGHRSAGIRFFYDSVADASQVPLTISPEPAQPYFLHSDGVPCANTVLGDSAGVTTRTLDKLTPIAAQGKCKQSGVMDADKPTIGANPFHVFSTWSLAPLQ